MKRIGILGGTFNPIHIGHLAIAQAACERLKLNSVLFIPSFYPPHKTRKGLISPKHRYKMVQLAIKGNPKFKADNYEIKRPKKSYSIETLEHLKKKYPGAKFFFIIGSDMLKGLRNWKRFGELKRLAEFVVVSRKGYKVRKAYIRVRSLEVLDLGISSSFLRRCLRAKKTVKYLLPDAVLAYIKKHKLYAS